MINWCVAFEIHHQHCIVLAATTTIRIINWISNWSGQMQLLNLINTYSQHTCTVHVHAHVLCHPFQYEVIYREFYALYLSGKGKVELKWREKVTNGHHFEISGDGFVFIWMILAVAVQQMFSASLSLSFSLLLFCSTCAPNNVPNETFTFNSTQH